MKNKFNIVKMFGGTPVKKPIGAPLGTGGVGKSTRRLII